VKILEETGYGSALSNVIPAKAGIQSFQCLLDSRLRGSDNLEPFSRLHQIQMTKTVGHWFSVLNIRTFGF